MSLQVHWTDRALKDVERLDRPLRHRIVAAIEAFATTERGDLKRLQGDKSGIFRLRVGDWRVLFSSEAKGEMTVRRILPRSGAYRP